MTPVPEPLHHQRRGHDARTAAAQFGRDRQPLDPELRARPPRIRRELPSGVTLREVLVQFPAGEISRRRLEFQLFVAQREIQLFPPPAEFRAQPPLSAYS